VSYSSPLLRSLLFSIAAVPISAQCLGPADISNGAGTWPDQVDILDLTALVSATTDCALGGDLGPAPEGSATLITTLEVTNDQSFTREEVAWSGIPIPRDLALTNTANLTLIDEEDRRIACQFDVLARWDATVEDGSAPIRWLQVSVPVTVEADQTRLFQLRRYDVLPPADDPYAIAIGTRGALMTVSTGLADFTLDPANPALLDGITALDGNGDPVPIYSHSPGAGPFLSFDDGGNPIDLDTATAGAVQIEPGSFEVIEDGPVKATFSLKGFFSAPGGASLCVVQGNTYERFSFTLILSFTRAARNVDVQYQIRNACSSANGGPWTDEAIDIHAAGLAFPFSFQPSATTWYHADGAPVASAPGFSGSLVLAQEKGGGMPWTRSARVSRDGMTQTQSEFFAQPLVARSDGSFLVSMQMPWLRYREPQALTVDDDTLSGQIISETLTVGEGKGIWSFMRLGIEPMATVRGVDPVAIAARNGSARLERGLLVRAPRDHVNAAALFPSLGTDATSAPKTAYEDIMNALHQETVAPGGQWDRAHTYGSQLWPDIQGDAFFPEDGDPVDTNGAMNYWNPSGAELLEFLRVGDPKWVWDFALPQSWLMMHSAYLNIGDETHGSGAGGLAVTSGGTGEGQWHRSAFGSDDYNYNMGMQLAYAIRPNPAFRDRFAQAGETLVARYSIPRADQVDREMFVNQVDITRQVIQHYEMLANCAEFVPGATGTDCRARLTELVEELATDNLAPGVLCQGDIPSPVTCDQPQQFMQSSLMVHFFHRYLRNWGDAAGLLERALVNGPRIYYEQGTAKLANGTDIDVNGAWAAILSCPLTNGGTEVGSCSWIQTGDGDLLWHNKPHNIGLILMAHELDPDLSLCALAKRALEHPDLLNAWPGSHFNQAGWWKGTAQMMQGAVFAIGIYDTCVDP